MSERWKPENGEHYYYFYYDGDVDSDVWRNDSTDRQLFERGNCFRTEAEAEAAAEKVKTLLLSLPANDESLQDNDESLQDNQLPKLTAEVFNRPDCPEWAKWAAVDYSGIAFFYENKPIFTGTCYQSIIGATKIIDSSIKWDITISQNILIERPVKMPAWCKVGEYGYDYASGYFKIIEIIDDGYNLKVEWIKEKVSGIVFGGNLERKYPARLSPYNADEMKALVGKVVEDKDGNFYLVVCYIPRGRGLLIGGFYFNEQEIIDAGFTIDGKPAGVFEHLDNGEWVQ